ncbi:MAG: hypothetical protein H8K06_18895 [Nitrospira sp.]|uniref:cysteine rich repeat-containing protein n=1 Tax=Nitrospira defluvii TaxID=330214 RepID=UPI001BB47E0A|nr:hypothetical protein [Nitrospira sp.]
MRIECAKQGICRLVGLLGGVVLGISGASGVAWSAGDAATPSGQDAPAVSSAPSDANGAGAEERRRGGRPGRKACAEDVTRLCANVKPGEGRIAQCLKAHTQDLSPTCAETVQQRSKRRP